jgi:hypothetical protein
MSITERGAIEGHWPMIKRLKKENGFSLILVGTSTLLTPHAHTPHTPHSPHTPGNKSDVDETATISDWLRTNQVREVTAQEGAALARKMSSDLGMPVPFLETSAKLNRNVSTAFGGTPSLPPPPPPDLQSLTSRDQRWGGQDWPCWNCSGRAGSTRVGRRSCHHPKGATAAHRNPTHASSAACHSAHARTRTRTTAHAPPHTHHRTRTTAHILATYILMYKRVLERNQ